MEVKLLKQIKKNLFKYSKRKNLIKVYHILSNIVTVGELNISLNQFRDLFSSSNIVYVKKMTNLLDKARSVVSFF